MEKTTTQNIKYPWRFSGKPKGKVISEYWNGLARDCFNVLELTLYATKNYYYLSVYAGAISPFSISKPDGLSFSNNLCLKFNKNVFTQAQLELILDNKTGKNLLNWFTEYYKFMLEVHYLEDLISNKNT